MADEAIVKSVQNFLRVVQQNGVPVSFGVLFGSYARGEAHQWSDIDVLVVSTKYDKNKTREDAFKLWRLAARTDTRIEPIAVGEMQFQVNENDNMIVAMARREGQIIPLAE